MMTAHQTTNILIRCFNRIGVADLDLFFDKTPTNEQLVEATRWLLSEKDSFTKDEALNIMEAVIVLGVPEEETALKHADVKIFHTNDFLFKVKE